MTFTAAELETNAEERADLYEHPPHHRMKAILRDIDALIAANALAIERILALEAALTEDASEPATAAGSTPAGSGRLGRVAGPYRYDGDSHDSYRIEGPDRLLGVTYASDGDTDAAEALALTWLRAAGLDREGA